MTGEEFGVQIKGRASITDQKQLPCANVNQSTINYWIGKLSPTMIALVDTTTREVYYDWLEYCYPSYPSTGSENGKTALALRHKASEHSFQTEVTTYLRHYYASLSSDMEALSKGIYLANLLFSVSALYRLTANALIDLQQIEPNGPDELKKLLDHYSYAFASHDQLMIGLRTGAFGHLPNKSRLFRLAEAKLKNYDEARSKIIIYLGETEEGDIKAQPQYGEFSNWLLPMLRVLEELQEFLGLAQVRNKSLTKRAEP